MPRPGLDEKALEMLAEHDVEHAVLGAPAHVLARSALARSVDPLPGRGRIRLHVAESRADAVPHRKVSVRATKRSGPPARPVRIR
jgi:hypothetical protein